MKISKTVFLFIALFGSFFLNYVAAQGPSLKRVNLILQNHISYSAETQRRTEAYIISQGYHKDSLYRYVLDFVYDKRRGDQRILITKTSPKAGILFWVKLNDLSKYPEQEVIKRRLLPELKKAEEQYKKKATFGFHLVQKRDEIFIQVYIFCD